MARFVAGMMVVTDEGERGEVLAAGTDDQGPWVEVLHPSTGWVCFYSASMLRPDWAFAEQSDCIDMPVAPEE